MMTKIDSNQVNIFPESRRENSNIDCNSLGDFARKVGQNNTHRAFLGDRISHFKPIYLNAQRPYLRAGLTVKAQKVKSREGGVASVVPKTVPG